MHAFITISCCASAQRVTAQPQRVTAQRVRMRDCVLCVILRMRACVLVRTSACSGALTNTGEQVQVDVKDSGETLPLDTAPEQEQQREGKLEHEGRREDREEEEELMGQEGRRVVGVLRERNGYLDPRRPAGVEEGATGVGAGVTVGGRARGGPQAAGTKTKVGAGAGAGDGGGRGRNLTRKDVGRSSAGGNPMNNTMHHRMYNTTQHPSPVSLWF